MTGSELAAALLERLREALQQAEVRAAYDGAFFRRGEICGIMMPECAGFRHALDQSEQEED